jgi:hypothetical protein
MVSGKKNQNANLFERKFLSRIKFKDSAWGISGAREPACPGCKHSFDPEGNVGLNAKMNERVEFDPAFSAPC